MVSFFLLSYGMSSVGRRFVWFNDIHDRVQSLLDIKEKALAHQEIGMYFWVIRITCPFKIITGQQGGKNLCSVVITKKFDKHYIFTLASISHWQPTFASKSVLSITLKVTVNSFNWIYVRPTGSVLFGQKSESIWIDQIHLGCLPRNLPSLILPTLWLYCLPEERNYSSAALDDIMRRTILCDGK